MGKSIQGQLHEVCDLSRSGCPSTAVEPFAEEVKQLIECENVKIGLDGPLTV